MTHRVEKHLASKDRTATSRKHPTMLSKLNIVWRSLKSDCCFHLISFYPFNNTSFIVCSKTQSTVFSRLRFKLRIQAQPFAEEGRETKRSKFTQAFLHSNKEDSKSVDHNYHKYLLNIKDKHEFIVYHSFPLVSHSFPEQCLRSPN